MIKQGISIVVNIKNCKIGTSLHHKNFEIPNIYSALMDKNTEWMSTI